MIAIFYTESLSFSALAWAAGLFGLAVAANRVGVRDNVVYLILAGLVWLALLKSGLHATLAGVLMASVIPASGQLDGGQFASSVRRELDGFEEPGTATGRGILSHQQQHIVEEVADLVHEGTTPLLRLEHALLPVCTFFVLPVFALINAGTDLGTNLPAALSSPVSIGIVLGLFFGKQLGILGFSWIAVRLGFAELSAGLSWRHVHGVAALGGIGFTMALFVNSLAFQGANLPLRDVAKVGILVGSALSGIMGWLLLRWAKSRPDDSVESNPLVTGRNGPPS